MYHKFWDGFYWYSVIHASIIVFIYFNLFPHLGIGSMTVPVYIAESSPPQMRGQLVTINTLFITAGQFVASLIDGAFSYVQHGGWRFGAHKYLLFSYSLVLYCSTVQSH